MSKLQYNRLFRFLVCLILVAAFLVNLSPLNVRAIDPATLYAVKFAAESVIASILISLGFEFCRYGMNEGISLVYDIFDYLGNELQPYYFVAGEMGLYTNNGVDFYVLQDTIDDIRNYLFAESILTESGVKQYWSYYGEHLLPTAPTQEEFPYMTLMGINSGFAMFLSEAPFYYVPSSEDMVFAVEASNTHYYQYYYNLNDWNLNSTYFAHGRVDTFKPGVGCVSYWKNYLWSNYDILSYADGSTLVYKGSKPITSEDILCSYDIALGHVASQDESLPVGYPEWTSGSVQVPGQISGLDEDLLGLPVALGTTFDETMGFNQQQAWQGLGTYQDQNQDIMDPTEATVPGYDQEVWVPPANPGQFALDLTKFFPFCIPFDVYAFFSCLNADPVTPVIHWEIAMPGGGSYPLTIDLSPFDSTAQLLRRLELLLFIVGLAIKTRDLIKG